MVCSECNDGDAVLVACSGTQDTVCSDCPDVTNAWLVGQEPCDYVCASGFYGAIDSSGAGVCTACSVCNDTSVVETACTHSTDTQCRNCDIVANAVFVGQGSCDYECTSAHYMSETGDCEPCTQCGVGEVVGLLCTSDSDSTCCTVGFGEVVVDPQTCDVECQSGTFQVR